MTDPASPEQTKKRFRALMEIKKIKPAQFAKQCGVTPQSIHEILEEGFTKPKLTNIAKYAEVLGVTPQYLLFEIEGPSFYKIPGIQWEEVVNWPSWTDTDKLAKKDKEFVFMEKEGYRHCYALRVYDDLMVSHDPNERSYASGETIIIDPSLAPRNEDFVIAYEKGSTLPILRKYIVSGSKHYLTTHKPLPALEITNQVEIYGVVRGKHLGTSIEVPIEDRPATLS